MDFIKAVRICRIRLSKRGKNVNMIDEKEE